MYDGGGRYTLVAKLAEEDSYTIVQDYLGTPIQALDSKGEVVWDCVLDYDDFSDLLYYPFIFEISWGGETCSVVGFCRVGSSAWQLRSHCRLYRIGCFGWWLLRFLLCLQGGLDLLV